MSLSLFTERVKAVVGEDSKLNATVKFSFDEGAVFVDAKQVPNVVTNDDIEADCVAILTLENANKLLDGELNAMNAFMMGKLKIKGDMGVAMKVVQIIADAKK